MVGLLDVSVSFDLSLGQIVNLRVSEVGWYSKVGGGDSLSDP